MVYLKILASHHYHALSLKPEGRGHNHNEIGLKFTLLILTKKEI